MTTTLAQRLERAAQPALAVRSASLLRAPEEIAALLPLDFYLRCKSGLRSISMPGPVISRATRPLAST